MSEDHVFVDANILVYAHDKDAGGKHLAAKEKLESLWRRSIVPCISIQVLQEFYVNLIRRKVKASDARETILNYIEWDVVENDRALLLEGIRLREKWSLSFWEALIIAAAKRANAKELWSEDLNTGQIYEGVVVVNPLHK